MSFSLSFPPFIPGKVGFGLEEPVSEGAVSEVSVLQEISASERSAVARIAIFLKVS